MVKLTKSAIEDFVVLGSATQETTQEISLITGQVAGQGTVQVTEQVITLLKARQVDITEDDVPDKTERLMSATTCTQLKGEAA